MMNFIQRSKTVPEIMIESYETGGYDKAESALAKINSKPNGRSIIQEVVRNTQNGKSLKIIVSSLEHAKARPVLTESQMKAYKANQMTFDENIKTAYILASAIDFGIKGEGTSAHITWNPNEGLIINKNGMREKGENAEYSFADLVHELVHGYRIMKGSFTGEFNGKPKNPGTPTWNEEVRAVGMAAYSNENKSENGVRKEHGLNVRKQY
ncbi:MULTISPECIES: XopG/HopH/AvrPtoH family type III secretion system effector [Pantoea]|uniref:Effector protein n=1 Tax=Candidatus Pantoea floridensis TaxID=1938870 RepID=A0A286BL99_9GAMM|nr:MULTISPECIES: XopG/HopH/AvrPtoH family type III secretion system effector [Pantoea]PIF22274.1 NleD-like pathogen effector protein (putative zinc metallopeptidase) [Enterobacteriaceae bacterium JKS000233]SOD34917.1 Effector protein [Pantoea floridensis]